MEARGPKSWHPAHFANCLQVSGTSPLLSAGRPVDVGSRARPLGDLPAYVLAGGLVGVGRGGGMRPTSSFSQLPLDAEGAGGGCAVSHGVSVVRPPGGLVVWSALCSGVGTAICARAWVEGALGGGWSRVCGSHRRARVGGRDVDGSVGFLVPLACSSRRVGSGVVGVGVWRSSGVGWGCGGCGGCPRCLS